MDVTRSEFDRYVAEAIDTLETPFRAYLDEVPVVVEDRPDTQVRRRLGLDRDQLLLGLFQGTPLNRRSTLASGELNQIVLYRRHLLAVCRNRAQLREQIRRTLVHELGHYLGFSEAELRERHY